RHGEVCVVRIGYRINQPGLRERAQVLVALHRDGVHDVTRAISRDMSFDADAAPRGVITVTFSRLLVANGNYTVTVMIARPGYYDEPQTAYFAINPGVYSCAARAFEITVEGGGPVASGTAVVSEAEWRLEPADTSGAALDRIDFPGVVAREFPSEFPVAWRAV